MLAARVDPEALAKLAIEARTKMNLRHAPLLLLTVLARTGAKREKLVANTVAEVIQRADELTELVAIYWRNGRRPLSAQLKKGLARAFEKFDAYELAKYDRPGPVRLRDVLFLVHAKPKAAEQAETWKKLAAKELDSPDTWEVALSGGADKRETFERLLKDEQARLSRAAAQPAQHGGCRRRREAGRAGDPRPQGRKRVLPFRFVAAARAAPLFDRAIDKALLAAIDEQPTLPGADHRAGRRVGLDGRPRCRARSDLTRLDAAAALGRR